VLASSESAPPSTDSKAPEELRVADYASSGRRAVDHGGSEAFAGFKFEDDRAGKERRALALLAELGIPGVTAEDLGKLAPADKFEAEIVMMAEVRAFFSVTYKVCLFRRSPRATC
jgi:hypothetical protein